MRNLSLFIAFRYVKSKKSTGFVSFIAAVSMLGIALGVMVLITVLSVLNGFDAQIKKQYFSVMPELTVILPNKNMNNPKIYKTIIKTPKVVAASPFIDDKAMASFAGQVTGLDLMGVLPSLQSKISTVDKHMIAGSFSSLRSDTFNIVLGVGLAEALNAVVGDKIVIITAQTQSSPLGVTPVYRRFTVSGIFKFSEAFAAINGSQAFISLGDAKRLFSGSQSAYGFHVRLNNMFDAQSVGDALTDSLPFGMVRSWMQTSGAFFQAVAMEKTMMFIILMLIIAVATFNLVSTLMMVVKDKQADIAIMRTLGAKPGMIMRVFIFQGAIIGAIGTVLGIIGGVLLADNAGHIVDYIQNTFHVQLIPASVYMVNYLPSKIISSDIIHVALIAFVLSVCAAIYPAWSAFKIEPAQALRYE